MKTNIEILVLVRQTAIDTEHFGICGIVAELWFEGIITNDERWKLRRWLTRNRPHNPFPFAYWWGENVWEPRIEWLDSKLKEYQLKQNN